MQWESGKSYARGKKKKKGVHASRSRFESDTVKRLWQMDFLPYFNDEGECEVKKIIFFFTAQDDKFKRGEKGGKKK